MMKYLFLLIFYQLAGSEFFIDDSILYKIDFQGLEETSSLGSEFEEDHDSYTLVSKNKEKYKCYIPKVQNDEEKKETKYTGQSPVELIETLFKQQQCVHRLESYWTYELCHGKILRQYHEERSGKESKLQEYVLGRYDNVKLEQLMKEELTDRKNDITRHPPTKKVQAINMPYLEIYMDEGTACDLNDQPRRAKILYMCYPSGRNEILSVKETSTCEYEVIVLTNMLCSHPQFKPEEVSEHGIKCRPLGFSPNKPADLVSLEKESSKLRSGRYWEAHFKSGTKPGQVKIEIRPSEAQQGEAENTDGEQVFHITKPKTEHWRESNRQPFKPMMDVEIVKQFLKGEHCLVGGSGWWKYEFCYGKKVDQFHVEDSGTRTVISLGKFSQEKHLKWIQEHTSKKPKPVERRKFVSHFYSDGDFCELSGEPRHVEVKLKCKEADSPSVVSLYLLEPKTCQYVLGVESPLVCDILGHADSNTGLMPEGLLDSLDKPATDESYPTEVYSNRGSFLSEIEEAVNKIKEFKGKYSWTEKNEQLKDLEDEGVFSKEEIDRLGLLKDRLRKRHERVGEEDELQEEGPESLKGKTFIYSSSTKQETSAGLIKEDEFTVDGAKIKLQEVIVDGEIVSTRVIRERVVDTTHTSSQKDDQNNDKDEL